MTCEVLPITSTNAYDNKDPDEVIICSIDFTDELENGETVASAVWKVICISATETTTSMVSGNVQIEGNIVKQEIKGGVLNHQYLHHCLATTSEVRKIVGAVYQNVTLGAL